ncbi:hypothetical protein P7H30_03915 [Streptococcus parauberis]|nr:hypothetical protein [Streptococcus parauberis]MDT2748896.1 hypothetical protein [Streptococcus parauberis]
MKRKKIYLLSFFQLMICGNTDTRLKAQRVAWQSLKIVPLRLA